MFSSIICILGSYPLESALIESLSHLTELMPLTNGCVILSGVLDILEKQPHRDRMFHPNSQERTFNFR